MAPFVDRLYVRTFSCVKEVDVRLTPLHAFIGPNDSGKSTLLRAIGTLASASRLFPGSIQPVWPPDAVIQAWSAGDWYRFSSNQMDGSSGVLKGAQLVRLEPDTLREPCGLIPHEQPVSFANSRGGGLAAVLDAMLSRHPETFIELRRRFIDLFPGVERIEIRNVGNHSKVIGATLVSGQRIGPAEMSEGMLYWLAFRALQYATKPAMLLIEEPENGLHPARIREVMALLREISKETQILIATHSPLVVNELQPDEITIITRSPKDGTIATPMRKTKNFEQRSKIYALGELWLSYADGELERELVGPDDPKAAKAVG